MVVIKISYLLSLDVHVEDLHHFHHLFRRILSSNHHVDAFQIRLAFQIAAITKHGGQNDKRCNRGDNRDNRTHGSSGSICADGGHDIHREKLFAVTAILQVCVPSDNVSHFMSDYGSDLGFVVHQSEQPSGDVNRSIRQRESVWHGISQRAKLPQDMFEIQTTRQKHLAHAFQISISRVIFKYQTLSLESPVKQVHLIEQVQIDFGKLKLFLWLRGLRSLGRLLLLQTNRS